MAAGSKALAVSRSLTQNAAADVAQEVDHQRQLLAVAGQFFHLIYRVFQSQVHLVNDFVSLSDQSNVFGRDAVAFHADRIDAVRFGWLAAYHDERGDILRYRAAHRGKAVLADFGKLMHQGKTAQNGVAVQTDVAGQGRAVRHDDVVSDNTVVGHVRISHKQVVVADLGDAMILLRSPMHGGKLPDGIAISDFQPGNLGRVFFVLRIFSDRGELVDAVVFADCRGAFDHDMRPDYRARVDSDVGPNHGIRADDNVVGKFSPFINYGSWIDQD